MSTDEPDLPEEGAKRAPPETEEVMPQLRPTWLMMEELARLLHLVPDEAERHYGLALIHQICQRDEEAIESLQITLESNPNHAIALGELGQIYLKRERYEDAVQLFEQMAKLGGSGSIMAITWLGMAYFRLAERGKAEGMLGESILQSVDPELVNMILERSASSRFKTEE
jgi:tetratricopeptide (TPR) repeat protein